MVDDHLKMRVSDSDRQATADRLRAALDEGRLKMDEYLERMERAYDAVTYADLAALCSDLPPATVAPRAPSPAAVPAAGPAPEVRGGAFARLPTALKVLWTIWLGAVLVNVVVWVLASASSAQVLYPWPVWVAGPYGAVLLAISVGVSQGRRGRGRSLPPPAGGSREAAPLPPDDGPSAPPLTPGGRP